MNRRLTKIGFALLAGAGLLALTRDGARAQAPTASISTVTNFTSSGYGGPNQDKVVFTISGAEAQQQSGGRFTVKQVKLEVFRLTGEREIVVEAPESFYDSAKQTANSTGRLKVQTGDGRFSVEGEGFLWRQTEQVLTISSRVRTVIHESPQTKDKP